MRILSIMSIILLTSVLVNAQTGNTSLTVSKGVQHVANKKAFEDEKNQKNSLEARSLSFPAIVVSKGVVQQDEVVAGNVQSKGYPAWSISKGVARQNLEQNQKDAESNEPPSEGIIKEGRDISKR